METKKVGRKPINNTALAFIHSKEDREFVLPRHMWKLVTPPGAHILRQKLGREYRVRTLADDSGWLIKRIK